MESVFSQISRLANSHSRHPLMLRGSASWGEYLLRGVGGRTASRALRAGWNGRSVTLRGSKYTPITHASRASSTFPSGKRHLSGSNRSEATLVSTPSTEHSAVAMAVGKLAKTDDAPLTPEDVARAAHGTNFDLVLHTALPNLPAYTVTKFKSRETGLTVVLASFPSPLVNGFFAVATELFEDTGLPHTLEHLIFLGSKRYPYKGVLDSMANRAFARGTNAWTDTDNTVYTITTAGPQGFLSIMPVFLDHVLNATITDSGFVTEVHHINGKGEDAGVVYSEMQGRENTPGDLMMLEMQRGMFPKGNAYRSETGGLMEKLRVLTNQEIRDYHHSYYASHNLCVAVTGKVDPSALLRTLQDTTEKDLVDSHRRQPSDWKRPFLETETGLKGPTKLAKNSLREVKFPDQDESAGEVMIGWLGPKQNDLLEGKAIDIIGQYLTDSPVAILQKEFVQCDDPACTDISFSSSDRHPNNALYAEFSSVPAMHLDNLVARFGEILCREAKEGKIDMTRINMLLARDKLRALDALETRPHDAFAMPIISDHLYGDLQGRDLEKSMRDMELYDHLATWSIKDWARIMEQYYASNQAFAVIGRPSATLAKEIEQNETKRVEEQRRSIGDSGLVDLQKKLDAAQKENERPIPDGLLEQLPVPPVESIEFVKVESGRNEGNSGLGRLSGSVQAHLDADPTALPYFVQYDHIDSKFVTLSMWISTTSLAPELRPYILLYLETIFSLPVDRKSGEHLSYEDVVKSLDSETIEYDAFLGPGTSFGEMFVVSIKVEIAKYDKAIGWLRDLIWGSSFATERLKIAVSRMGNDLPSDKRDGNKVASHLLRDMHYNREKSTYANASLFEQTTFLPKVADMLDNEPEEVVRQLEALRACVAKPENIRISVAGDILKLAEPKIAFEKHFQSFKHCGKLSPVANAVTALTDLGKNPSKKAVIISLPSIESGFAFHTALGPHGYNHPDAPALVVLNTLLGAMEGPLWRFVRGTGLAYGANMGHDLGAGHLYFSVYRAPDAFRAWEAAGKVIKELAEGKTTISKSEIVAAKSSVVYSMTEKESTQPMAAQNAFMTTVLKGLPAKHTEIFLKQIQTIELPDLLRVLHRYSVPLFDAQSSDIAVTTGPGKVADLTKSYTEQGFECEIRELYLGDDTDGSETSSMAMSDA